MLAYTLTPASLNVYFDGRMRTLNTTHPNFTRAVELVQMIASHVLTVTQQQDRLDELLSMLDIRKFVARMSLGRVDIGDDEVRLDGQRVHGFIAERIMQNFRQGYDLGPITAFLEKLGSNPTADVRFDLYEWLEAAQLPLCPDGDFIAFKKVKSDYKSYHDSAFNHAPGMTVSMARADCDDNRNNTCSSGLHFCSFEYLPQYYGNEGRVMVLKINPADVVAIPRDYKLSKGRACKYEIIGEVPEEEAKTAFENVAVLSEWDDWKAYDDGGDDYDDDDADYDYDDQTDALTYALYDPAAADDEPTWVRNMRQDGGHPYTTWMNDAAAVEASDPTPYHLEAVLNGEHSMLAYALIWSATPQGHDYWSERAYDHIPLTGEDRAFLRDLLARTKSGVEN